SRCVRQSSCLTSSPDHLMGLQEDGRGNRQAQGLGGLRVDDQLELGGLLHGEVGGIGSFENLVHIGGCAPMAVRQARPIGHQAPSLHIHFPVVHGGQLVRGGKIHNPSEQRIYQRRVRQHHERVGPLEAHRREGGVQLVRTVHL